MIEDPQVKKLRMDKAKQRLFINVPESFSCSLPYSNESDARGKYDYVHIFVRDTAELAKYLPEGLEHLDHDGLFWVTYPKKSSGIETDISRDNGWDLVYKAGYGPVSLVSLDETYSAMRFRQEDLVKRKRGSRVKPETFTIPNDMELKLKANPAAAARFEKLSFTHRKEYVEWITKAKKEETRQRRLDQLIDKILTA